MKLFDDHGRELDAIYSVEPYPGGFDLVLESRGGSDHGPHASRNSDYAPALELHLSRMGALGMILQDLQVASRVAMQQPEADRRVTLDTASLPLALSGIADLKALRHSIGRASASYGRTDGSDRGNRTKRMRLRMEWSGAAGMPVSEIEHLLSRTVRLEDPTSDPDDLEERVRRAETRMKAAAKSGAVPSPPGQKVAGRSSGTTQRFIRDPNVIAWVLLEADGRCEKCRKPAPFRRSDGGPYLEVHHVRPLGEGGPDTTDNAVACCPNCHRQLHYDARRDDLRLDVIAAVSRLKDYPAALTGVKA